MSNLKNIRPELTSRKVLLGGKERTMLFDMNALAILDEVFGGVESVMRVLSQNKLHDIQICLWASIVHEEVKERHPITGMPLSYNINAHDVGKWVTMGNLMDVSEQLSEVFIADMPEDIKEDARQKAADEVNRLRAELDANNPYNDQGKQVITATVERSDEEIRAEEERVAKNADSTQP